MPFALSGHIWLLMFPISRDPPEGGTTGWEGLYSPPQMFPISRDPPEGGTSESSSVVAEAA